MPSECKASRIARPPPNEGPWQRYGASSTSATRMSSTACRCYGGTCCPHEEYAEAFFQGIKPDDLSRAVKEAVSDYVELRGLNGLCPDVRKWSSPPAPAAFLDAGLPKTGGTGSLPRGLLPSVSSSTVVGAPGEFRGCSSEGKNQAKKSGPTSGTSVENVVSFADGGSSRVHDGNRRLSSGSRHGVRRRSSLESVASSIPQPSWEAEGPDGFISQVLSFDTLPAASTPATNGILDEGSSGARGLMASQSTPELGGNSMASLLAGDITAVDAKQLLRRLRQQTKTSRHRRHVANNSTTSAANPRGGARTSRPSFKDNRGGKGPAQSPPRTGVGLTFPPFSPPDAWDDTGLFTVAPRPKTVPSRNPSRIHHDQQHQRPTLASHTLASPVFASRTSDPPSFAVAVPPDSNGRNVDGSAVVGTVLPSELWQKGQEIGLGRSRSSSDGFGLWPKRRRKVGGGAGDAAVEFLDVREAALVSVAESLARRALPWQAQLCPRALQDLEIARVKIFHASEKKRQAMHKARQDEIFRGQLLGEERSWELFGRAQGRLFEGSLDKIADYVKVRESDHAAYVAAQTLMRTARVQRVEGLGRDSIDMLEQGEADSTWLCRRTTQVDVLWDPSACVATKEREEQRANTVLEVWRKGHLATTSQLDASIWLEAVGARALASEESARWKREVKEMVEEDGRRAEADRASERGRSSDRYSSMLQRACESDRDERGASQEAWNLQGWLSVGSHKLVQQTLRALVRGCSHPYAVRDVLWEARNAAEFAAAARAAAASQLADDSRGFCDARRGRKAMVRQHKQDILLAEERRSSAEDAERGRAGQDTIETFLSSSVTAKRNDIFVQVQEERASMLAAREAEVERCDLFRKEMLGVQHEVDEEAKRVAASLREWREEQEQQIKAEVSFAVSSLAEEKARAADREALLREMLLTERDKEDRLLEAWLLRQEREGCATVNSQLLEARKQLTEDRERWVNDTVASMSETAGNDAAFFQSPHAWGRSGTSHDTIASGHTAPERTLVAGGFRHDLRQTMSADGEPGAGKGHNPAICESSGLLLSTLVEVQACRQNSSLIGDEPQLALWTAKGEERDRSRLEFDAAVPTTAAHPSHGVSNKDNANNGNYDRMPILPATVAFENETLAARKRSDHLESLAVLARQGMSAHWNDFFRDGVERTRMAAEAGNITAERWAQHQRQAIEVSRASWRSREWTSGSSTSDSGVDGGDGHVSGPEGRVTEGDGGGCSTRTLDSTKAEGHQSNEDGERSTATGLSQDAAQSPKGGQEGGDGGDPCVIVVRDVGGSGSINEEAVSSESGTSPTAAAPAAPAATTDKIVVFVGRAMVFHMSTVREGRMDPYNRRRCSSVSLPPQPGQPGQRPSCTVSSIDIDALDPDGVVEQSREAGWLKALEHLAEHNTVLDLGEVGATFGVLPGGAAVLCLAHDCLVQGPGETEGFVRMDVLLSATSAFIALRRSIRAKASATKTPMTPRCEPNAAPAAGDGGDGNTLDSHPTARGGEGKAVAVGSGEPLGVQPVPEIAPPSPPLISGSETVTSNATAMTTTPTMMSIVVAAVAETEVAAELEVYGDALSADLARVWLHPSSLPFLGDGGGTVSDNAAGASQPRSQAHGSCSQLQTRRIRREVEKHSAVLSPQSVCALTALLSAKGKEWADHTTTINQKFNDDYGVCGGRDDYRNGDGGGPRREDSSPVGDPAAWKLALSRALLVVRTASLEHLALWADACDPGKVESACAADVSRAVMTPETRGVPAPGMDSGDAEAPARAAGDGDEKAVDGGGGTYAAWAALHRASGLGLSPLMMLATTLFEDESSTGAPQLFLGDRDGAARKTSADSTGNAHGGAHDSAEPSSVANLTIIMSRSVLRLLSRNSLDNVYRCLSRHNASRGEEELSSSSSAAATAGGEGGAEASTTQEGLTNPESNSENRPKLEGSCGFETEENPEVLSDVPGHPAIGDLSKLDSETLRGGAEGIVEALDARGTGWLPPAVLAVALQSGEAGFRLESGQADVVLRLSGCWPATSCPENLRRSDQQQVPAAAVREEQDLEKANGGDYSYLGYPPRTQTVRYRPLLDQLPGLLRLVQAAHRLGKAATLPAACKSSTMTLGGARAMTSDALERNRQTRFQLSIERSGTALLTALEAACQRMAYTRLKLRSSLLEAPRLETMQRLADHARERTSSERSAREIENDHRAEVRRTFTSATKNKVEVASGTGTLMVNMERARAAATGELFAAVGLATEQARQQLIDAVEQLNTVMTEAEQELLRDESFMKEEDRKAREERDQEPEWWGESLTKEVKESYRQEAIAAQEVTANILEEASAMDETMAATWEDDAQSCKVAFAETGQRLETVMAEFEERRMASREVIGAANRDANRTSPSSSSLSSSTSSLQLQSEKKEQADFAESVQLRHRGTNLCRENLAWLGDATHHLEAECVGLCERAAALPDRMEKRLSSVLNTAHAKGVEARSVVVRRLHAGSKSWGDELVQRKQRWRNLRAFRRTSFEHTRAMIESERERLGRLGPVASAARTVVLAQALHMAREPVNRFPHIAGKGPLAVKASEAVAAAAAVLTQTHDAVRSIVAEASGGDAAGTGLRRGGGQLLRTDGEEDKGRVGSDGEDDGRRGVGSVGSGGPESAVKPSENEGGRGEAKESGGGGDGEGAAQRLWAMEAEDATARVSACQTAIGEWWERQARAVAEGMRRHEEEAADRRTRREVEHLLSESVIADIEAREKAEAHGRKTLALVLSEAKRIANQFVDALKSADARINDAAANSKMAVEEESEVLSLEAQSLAARVSATLQRGLNAATEDLAAAQQHRKNRKNKKILTRSPSRGGEKSSDTRMTHKDQFSEGEQEGGESVFGISSDESAADLAPSRNHQEQLQLGRDDRPGSASGSASTSGKKSRLPFQVGFGAGG